MSNSTPLHTCTMSSAAHTCGMAAVAACSSALSALHSGALAQARSEPLQLQHAVSSAVGDCYSHTLRHMARHPHTNTPELVGTFLMNIAHFLFWLINIQSADRVETNSTVY